MNPGFPGWGDGAHTARTAFARSPGTGLGDTSSPPGWSQAQREHWWLLHIFKVLGRPPSVRRAQAEIDAAAASIVEGLAVAGMDGFSLRMQQRLEEWHSGGVPRL